MKFHPYNFVKLNIFKKIVWSKLILNYMQKKIDPDMESTFLN